MECISVVLWKIVAIKYIHTRLIDCYKSTRHVVLDRMLNYYV